MSTSSTTPPVLLACAHGTRDPGGQRAVEALVAAVRARLPGVHVVDTWVDVQEPDLVARTTEHTGDRAVVVPLLLSAGYHVFVDMARAVQGSPHHRVAAALGPDRRLARVLARRLTEALDAAGEAAPGPADEIVMVSAGSSDPRAGQDCERVAAMLAEELGHPVASAYLSAARPALDEALDAARHRIVCGAPERDATGPERRGPEHPASALPARTPQAAADLHQAGTRRGGDAAAPAHDAAGPAATGTAPSGTAPVPGVPALPGRVLLVPYLLAPGFFHGRALAAGADVTAQPLLVHPGDVPPELVDLVVEHYRETASKA
ncbi:sirohydrochlorin chelatase [Kocuria rhizophila]|uniref:sirohydrochlorin chelatase n=1 Tax=Kocuria rhizophila TaxID=72000 RepID=UPI001D2FFE3F|nr:CbiX/SirB N-terminal domain-containing protein [Kocuria rhizophila]MCC5670934.1 hypothetical protein [Kocuria rhizophila]